MECKKCGAYIGENYLFCPKCGAKVEKQEPVQETVFGTTNTQNVMQEVKPIIKVNKTPAIIIAIVCILGCIFSFVGFLIGCMNLSYETDNYGIEEPYLDNIVAYDSESESNDGVFVMLHELSYNYKGNTSALLTVNNASSKIICLEPSEICITDERGIVTYGERLYDEVDDNSSTSMFVLGRGDIHAYYIDFDDRASLYNGKMVIDYSTTDSFSRGSVTIKYNHND